MSHLKNLDRDVTWVLDNEVTWGASTVWDTSDQVTANVDQTVYEDFAFGYCNETESITSGNYRAFGVLIRPPVDGYSPYRVKARCNWNEAAVFWGITPASITATIDVTPYVPLHFDYEFDDCLMVYPDATNPDRPICFGIALYESLSAKLAIASISVQRLATKSPVYSSSIT